MCFVYIDCCVPGVALVCPIQNSDYIERAMEYLIQPVITATSRFKPESQLLALSTAISGLCEAWTTSILSQKIRFRLASVSMQ